MAVVPWKLPLRCGTVRWPDWVACCRSLPIAGAFRCLTRVCSEVEGDGEVGPLPCLACSPEEGECKRRPRLGCLRGQVDVVDVDRGGGGCRVLPCIPVIDRPAQTERCVQRNANCLARRQGR